MTQPPPMDLPPQYPAQPVYQQQVVYQQIVHAPSNGQATAALILGIAAIFFGISVPIPVWGLFMAFLAGPLGIVAVILGHLALNTSKRINVGRGAALTGLILGYVTLGICAVTTLFWIVAYIAGAATSISTSY